MDAVNKGKGKEYYILDNDEPIVMNCILINKYAQLDFETNF